MDPSRISNSSPSSESEFFLEKQITFSRQQKVWPWIFTTIFFFVISIALFFKPAIVTCNCDANTNVTTCSSQQIWRRSDFASARDAIELEEVQFYGNSAFDDNGRFFVNNPPPINYIGTSPEVEEAWRNLTLDGQRDFVISEKEAQELWPNNYKIHWHERKKGYVVGLDVFHTLHCLDNIRKYLNPDVYPISEDHKEGEKLHQGHCLDQIRQYVQCAGDMTPYGMRWYPNPGRNYADSDVTHTCRNFGKLQEWVSNRYHAGGNVHIPGVEIWSPFENGV